MGFFRSLMLNRKSSIDKYCLNMVFSMKNKLSDIHGTAYPSGHLGLPPVFGGVRIARLF